jgi:hypothetical protein
MCELLHISGDLSRAYARPFAMRKDAIVQLEPLRVACSVSNLPDPVKDRLRTIEFNDLLSADLFGRAGPAQEPN